MQREGDLHGGAHDDVALFATWSLNEEGGSTRSTEMDTNGISQLLAFETEYRRRIYESTEIISHLSGP